MNWNLKSGVIIIGSLLWQDYLEEVGDNIRLNWRNSNLDFDNRIQVKVPIRYGRISEKSATQIPTMVFSNDINIQFGFGYVVPFKKIINNIKELTCETIALSKAEGMKGDFVKNWGLLTYLFNDNKISSQHKKEIVSFFDKQKNSTIDNINQYENCVKSSLELNIDWIAPILKSDTKKLNSFDFLLATATKPSKEILTIEEIAKGIKSDNIRKYFLNNLSNGIITNQDFDISKLL